MLEEAGSPDKALDELAKKEAKIVCNLILCSLCPCLEIFMSLPRLYLLTQRFCCTSCSLERVWMPNVSCKFKRPWTKMCRIELPLYWNTCRGNLLQKLFVVMMYQSAYNSYPLLNNGPSRSIKKCELSVTFISSYLEVRHPMVGTGGQAGS